MAVKLAGSAAVVAAASLLVWALQPIAPTLSLVVLYTPAVLAAAIPFGFGYAAATAVVSMLVFNFFFLPPVHTLTLADGRNWTALAVFLVTAVVASDLATRARRRAVEAEQRTREAELLADAAAALLREAPLDELALRIDDVLAGADDLTRARFGAAMRSLDALAVDRRESEAIKRSDALKTVVLQTVSHDLRTPLATITAAVGGLEHGGLELSEGDRRGLLESIRLESGRLSRLVENVLDLSRLQTGTASPRRELWSVDDVVDQAVEELADASRVVVDIPDGLPPVLVDAVQIQRALANLIENALKFSEDDVDVVARLRDGSVAIEVGDRGPGRERAVSSAQGLGLGLEIAHGFARMNDAELELTDRTGGGTTARLTVHTA